MDERTKAEITQQVGAAVSASRNELLTQLDSLITSKLGRFEAQITDTQKNISENQLTKIQQGILCADNYKFSMKSCEEQHKFNNKVLSKLHEARQSNQTGDAHDTNEKISEGINLLAYRQKLIKLADSSEAGWKTVEEYISNPIASDSEDEKKMDRARTRANRKAKAQKQKPRRFQKGRFHPYEEGAWDTRVTTTSGRAVTDRPSMLKPGTCFACGNPGHWRRECPTVRGIPAAAGRSTEKISTLLLFDENVDWVDEVVDPVVKAGSVVNNDSTARGFEPRPLSPIGRLRNCLSVWENAGACDAVLQVIGYGYKLPFKVLPSRRILENNKSAKDNQSFVGNEIAKLISIGSVSEVSEQPEVVNPLTVAYSKKGKPRLVLDCRHINPGLHQFKFKYEDAVVARDVFEVGDFVFTFDLKSAYHHIEIWPVHRRYLGFSWISEGRSTYYQFNVLPFGIATAGYIFTKVTKECVKHWRSKGHHVVMYLDDGIGGHKQADKAAEVSKYVRNSLMQFGFIIADEKCSWEPSQNVTWLGYTWCFGEGVVRITAERMERLLTCLDKALALIDRGKVLFKARWVAGIVGQIISMQGVFGRQVRLRTRCLYNTVLTKASWNAPVLMGAEAICELKHWRSHAESMNCKGSGLKDNGRVSGTSTVTVCSDASDTGYGGYVYAKDFLTENEGNGEPLEGIPVKVGIGMQVDRADRQCVLGSWEASEAERSSTWRELEGAKRVLLSVGSMVKGRNVKLVMDSKNACSIVHTGSRKPDLQDIALEINEFCGAEQVVVQTQWVPRELNKSADFLSRCSDSDDWGVQLWVFEMCEARWGPHTVDRFACDYNAKCSRFNSRWWCSGTESVDAFTQVWSGENNWLVPPPRLCCKVLRKIKQDNAVATLVIPEWESASYWPELTAEKTSLTSSISDFISFGHEDVTMAGLRLKQHVREALQESGIQEGSYMFTLGSSLAARLPTCKADSTNTKYFALYKRWENFISDQGFRALPADSIHIALFLTHLLDNGASAAVTESAMYAIKWAHDITGLADPTKNVFVRNIVESARRTVKAQVKKKEPVTSQMLVKLCDIYKDCKDLLIVRDLTMMLLAFAAFLRFNEFVALRCSDILIKDNYFSIKISKSKTDQYRQGDEVVVSKGTTSACPLAMILRYADLAKIDFESSDYLFKQVVRSKTQCKLIFKSKQLSYTAVRETILKRLRLVAGDVDIGLHSLRAGGVSAASGQGVNDRCLMRHGRWRSQVSKDGYVKDSLGNRLQVSQKIGI